MPELEPTAYDVKGVEVLLTGKHAGIDINEAYLDAMVSNFNPVLHEPKVTYGHVKDDEQTDPVRGRAAGKVSRIYREGNRLLADYAQVEPEAAADMKGSGMWNKRSVEIYPDFQGKGPALRNVAALSAIPPQVKGMRDIADDQIVPVYASEGSVQYHCCMSESADDGGYSTITILQEEHMADTHVTMSESEVKALIEQQVKAALGEKDAEIAKLSEENAKLAEQQTAEVKKLQEESKRLAEDNAKRRAREIQTDAERFCEKMEAEGKMSPGERKVWEQVIAAAESAGGDTIKLSETEDEVSLAEGIREAIEARKPWTPVPGQRAAAGIKALATADDAHSAIVKLSEEKGISYEEAAKIVDAGGK